ncbi:MAG: hypothetical protein GVY35_04815, partial [Bacteroidetes bacterium]|nr:hypothetical protein [Bacteroidota bacterium]
QRRRSGNEDADAWERLGFVDGAGTTTEAQTYRFTDRDLPYAAPGAVYRLRQVDTDGTETLSEAVEITRAAPTELQLQAPYPNPARSRATVRFTIPAGAGGNAASRSSRGVRLVVRLPVARPPDSLPSFNPAPPCSDD